MDIKSTQTLSLDFNKNERKPIKIKQYDKNSRFLKIKCLDSGKFVKLDSATIHAKIKMLANGDRPVLNDAVVNEDGTVTVEFTETMLADSGVAKAELILFETEGGALISTMPFDIIVEASVYSNDRVIASEEFNALTNLMIDSQKEYDEMVALNDESRKNEDIRIENENARSSAEATRASNESSRVKAESSRVTAEKARAAEAAKVAKLNIEPVEDTDSYKYKLTDKNGSSHETPNLLNKVSIGTVKTLDVGSPATASFNGDFGEQKLNLGLPAGTRGSYWHSGTKITGTNTAPTVFDKSGVEDARMYDMYLNSSTCNVYVCVKPGNSSVAQWSYSGCIKGEPGIATNVTAASIPMSTTDNTSIKDAITQVKNHIVISAEEPDSESRDDRMVWIEY